MREPPAGVLHDVAQAISRSLNFTFLASAGAGAFKETYEVIDPHGHRYALKVFRPGMSSQRTDREVDAMQRCSHPNIAKVVALNTFSYMDQQYVYLIEDFLPGGSLHERVERKGLYSVYEMCALARSLVDAVGHIASLSLVHRDLKPENILLDSHESPVIDDFGIVRDLADTSLTQSWLLRGPGTPYYASPEQLNNEKYLIDWRADQFSLGIVLSIITFGVHPYAIAGMRPDEVVETVAARQGPSPTFRATVDAARVGALARMVAPWPVNRFRTTQILSSSWEIL